jgi:hypothetical protein
MTLAVVTPPPAHAIVACPGGSGTEDLTVNLSPVSDAIGVSDYFLLTGTSGGGGFSCGLSSGTTTGIMLDPGTSYTISGASQVPPANEEFCIAGPPGSCTDQTNTLGSSGTDTATFVYFHQYLNLFSYYTNDASTPTLAPKVRCPEFGVGTSFDLTLAGVTVWCDAGSTAYTPNSVIGGSHEQWTDTADSSFPPITSGGATPSFLYYDQFTLTYSYIVNGGGNPDAPWFTCQQQGYSASFTLTGSPTSYWCDTPTTNPSPVPGSGTWQVQNPLNPNGSFRRWITTDTTVGTVAGPINDRFQYWHQVIPIFQINANAQTTFDNGFTATLTGTLFGVHVSDVCTITTFSTDSYDQCTGTWVDADSRVTFPATLAPTGVSPPACATSVPTTCRWITTSGLPTNVEVTDAATYFVDYWKQWNNQFDYTVVNDGTTASGIMLWCSQQGTVSAAGTLTESLQYFWCDNGATATAGSTSSDGQVPTPSPSLLARYIDFSPPGGQSFTISSGGNSYTFDFYHQFAFILSYKVMGGGSPTPPALTCFQFGSSGALSPALPLYPSTPQKYWCDNDGAWMVDNPIAGASGERWYSSQTTSGTVGTYPVGSLTTVFVYYHQYAVSFAYSLDEVSSPTVTNAVEYWQNGNPLYVTPAKNPPGPGAAQVWVDAGYNAFYRILPTSGLTNERWVPASGVQDILISGPWTTGSPLTIEYFHQFELVFSYSLHGAGVPSTLPTLTCTQLDVPMNLGGLSTSPTGYWCDAGHGWSVSASLAVQSADPNFEAWYSQQATSGTVGSALTRNFVYWHQIHLIFSYSVNDNSVDSDPQITVTQFGATSAPITIDRSADGGTQLWVDLSSTYCYPATHVLPASTGTERWYSPVGCATTAYSNINVVYTHQYHVIFAISPVGHGTATPGTGWYNAGSTITISATAGSGHRFVDWTATGSIAITNAGRRTTTATIGSSGTITAVFT